MDNNFSPSGEDTRKKGKKPLIWDNTQHDIEVDQIEKFNQKD